MIKYTNRTCDKCGARKPQPDMIRKEVYVETGKSKATVTNDTYWWMAFGDKAASRAVKRALANSGERTYTRKKTVWSCRNCRAPDSNYVPPAPKRIARPATNAPKVGGVNVPVAAADAQVVVPKTRIGTFLHVVKRCWYILQKIIDRLPRTIFGWIILLYAVVVVLALLDGG